MITFIATEREMPAIAGLHGVQRARALLRKNAELSRSSCDA
jgi:hypothetical protein